MYGIKRSEHDGFVAINWSKSKHTELNQSRDSRDKLYSDEKDFSLYTLLLQIKIAGQWDV